MQNTHARAPTNTHETIWRVLILVIQSELGTDLGSLQQFIQVKNQDQYAITEDDYSSSGIHRLENVTADHKFLAQNVK